MNKLTGEGIKQTHAYETPLSKHDLEKWRKEFWGKWFAVSHKLLDTRTQGSSQVWNLLNSACSEDSATAEALILASGLQMPNNSLTLVIDEQGIYYRLPVCVINDPLNFNADFAMEKLKNKEQPPEQTI